MNIIENLQFHNDKPSVAIIKKNENIKYFAVGLGKNAVLQKHTTAFPATLVVAKGKIDFKFEDRNYILNTLDTFEIPVDEMHEVHGLEDENVFLVCQEL
ncbi:MULTISPECIES: cupin domain-containing protein [Amniculibacterium]|jgi:quercetin dioxygenase-like cupin family protein|uniref:cupin domain-containing protein n=1 Tax=Amniculibacterium TaxID=2715289 RepID=UPI000F5A37AB|nr:MULTISPECIES: hypothetical protein [Amniculibacterium]